PEEIYAINYFFCQAEDGIRARTVTGVQTCALPISRAAFSGANREHQGRSRKGRPSLRCRPRLLRHQWHVDLEQNGRAGAARTRRSEERRVGKGGSSEGGAGHCDKR